MTTNIYHRQVELLMKILPHIFLDTEFALRGGTAINFFYRNMPRYSVDIDLTYTKIYPRNETLTAINDSFLDISRRIKNNIKTVNIKEYKVGGNLITKLYIKEDDVEIKIETSTTIRGAIYKCEERPLCDKAVEVFGRFTSVKVLSFAETFGSKLCAALDRQHPRDIFDAMLLLKNEGITEQVRKAFIVYLISHNRPMAELLAPNLSDMQLVFDNEFSGMVPDVKYSELVEYRKIIVKEINEKLTSKEKEFLISFKSGAPVWELLDVDGVEELPGVKWKLENINKMDKVKHKKALAKLGKALKL
ncbi:MAG: hypothetical protein A2452_03475 [Candidatus Firestonebacteria bacterium RIFOXYC2_FULL_39_67]|nr:MAG: hypothetical protein A2536_02890 [Candidatus Firestonebacteria bacterium RIFOXYD2_FULL_39_29]OGF53129.1 MAG: hypothetical protein A2497_08315 [Candidatus Firestonebacteria bacterium RifOxyC12_full_39_7]OGF55328.1 MAG: hypothetical protein A2452_03475 [Candidatus Firestonebacteria bacterium RIFOXYC2_FULL_39_67]